MVSLEQIAQRMQESGANKIIYKLLSNNDNSKQQIYMASDFELLKELPTGEIKSGGVSSKMGPIFKAPLNLFWMDADGNTEQAKYTQLILYPKYPEVRLSGFLQKCLLSPSGLMQPPTPEERAHRIDQKRCFILGICHDCILAYVSSWDDDIALSAKQLISDKKPNSFNSVFL